MDKVIYLIIFLIYALFMLGIGFYFYNKNKNMKDYILGGRSLNPWVAAMSAQASDMSGWLLMALPGLAYISTTGRKEAMWTAIGLLIGTYLNWIFVAKRLRSYSEVTGNSLTIPEYFSNRFKDKKGVLKMVCAVFILFFFTIYTASMFVAGAKLFNNIFGLNYHIALIIGSVVIISYTFLGGFLAVSWTDLIQGILMFLALLIVPIVMIVTQNNVDFNSGMTLLKEGFTNLSADSNVSIIVIISSLVWGLGYFGQPHILARFMGIKKASFVRPARVISMIWGVLTMIGALTVGMLGSLYFANAPLADKETVFMEICKTLFNPVLAGILLSAILAAIMSTADSQLLVASSAFSNDIVKTVLDNSKHRDKNNENVLLWVSRLTVIVISIIAIIIAWDPKNQVLDLVSYAWAGFGAAFGGVILLSLYWKRMNKFGAYTGVIVGGLSTIIFYNIKNYLVGQNIENIFTIYEILPAFILSVVSIIIVSLATGKPSKEIEDEFELAKVKLND